MTNRIQLLLKTQTSATKQNLLNLSVAASLTVFGMVTSSSCASSNRQDKRTNASEQAGDVTGQRTVTIPISVQESSLTAGLNLAGNRKSFARFLVSYRLTNETTDRTIPVGYNISVTPPQLIQAQITGPLGAVITVTRVTLVDFKTDNQSDPIFVNQATNTIGTDASNPFVLSRVIADKSYSYGIYRNAINPTTLAIPPTALNITYAVNFSLADCLNDATVPDANGTNCIRNSEGIGSGTSSSSVQTTAPDGMAAPKVEWNRAASRLLAVTSATSSPILGNVLIALDCRGLECPTRVKAADGIGHRFYVLPAPLTRIPTATATPSVRFLNSAMQEVSDPLAAITQNPQAMFCIEITLGGIALQRPTVVSPQWFNDFRFELERTEGNLVGRSTFTLVGKQVFTP